MPPWEKALAHAAHWGLYVIMVGMPLTGWLMVSASRIAIPTLLYGVVPWPDMPGVAALAPGAKQAWHDVGETSHVLLSYGFYALFALHVAGALKHQFFPQDAPVLPRMLPGGDGRRRWADWRLGFVLVAVVAAVALGKLVTPPNPGMAPPSRPAQLQSQPPAPAADLDEPAAPPALAAEASSAAPPAPLAGPVRWVVQPGATLGFATSWGGEALQGRFDRWRAEIVFSPQALDRSKVTVTIDLASVETGDAQRDAALPSPDWFDTAAHPQAVFTATKFEKTGPDRYLAHGTLQLRGVTRPQALAFRLKIDGDRAQATGSASLDRTAFGVGQGDFKGTDQIPGKVAVTFALKASRARD
jgi:polyisoprenoid-binding protein YceI